MNIGMYLLLFIGGGIGILTTLFAYIGIIAIIVWKIYRKIRFGYRLYD